MIVCTSCKKSFHPMCIKSGQPSPLAGDVYFIFTCENCSTTGAEVVKRKKLKWTIVIILALYNLQLSGTGKCGYFRWREHICCFIDKHWSVFFNENRKKSATWHGTVAGALSSGANRYFVSGVEVLGETGWWSLKSNQLPSIDEMEVIKSVRPRKRQYPTETVVDWPRKRSYVEAAVASKATKASTSTIPEDSSDIRRLFRKLMVQKLKREHNVPLFDLDAQVQTLRRMDQVQDKKAVGSNSSIIIDRYRMHTSCGRLRETSFITRLMGLEEESCIVSPYTERILKAYIFRDFESKPVKMRLMEELLARTNHNNPDWKPPPRSSIDYCYIRPQHIPGVNALCQEFFWPGIDMSESLQYPDFTCVALYKKLIIGFASMVPNASFNEAYITFIFVHPEWQRSGIGTFMMYHLIQTCMGKDVTLHVSALSPAMFLYWKFGFKVEELIYDFYNKYLPTESKECRHAFFLRLSR